MPRANQHGNAKKQESSAKLPVGPPGIDRRLFLKLTLRAATGLLLAGSVGALAGCGSQTVESDISTPPGNSPSTGSRAPRNSEAPGSRSAGPQGCPLYSNGVCTGTGQACTNCRAH